MITKKIQYGLPRLTIIMILGLFFPLSAEADGAATILQKVAEVTEACDKGDYVEALDKLWLAQEAIWNKAPLAVRNVAFVTEQPKNFGTYQPRTSEDFNSLEPLILYCEPIGFTQLKEGETYHYSLIGAFEVLDAQGNVLGGQKNIGPYTQSNYRTFSTETMLTMTINIQGLPVESYILRVTLTDNLDPAKSVQLEKPFNIVL